MSVCSVVLGGASSLLPTGKQPQKVAPQKLFLVWEQRNKPHTVAP